MSSSTPATHALEQAKIAFTPLHYDYEKKDHNIGMHAALAVGERPSCVLKTLMVETDGRPVCVIIPSDKELSMKLVAAAFKAKSAQMMKPNVAERLTGYHVGGISPFGQKKKVPVALEISVMSEPYVIINGGQRGLLLKLKPDDALSFLNALTASLYS